MRPYFHRLLKLAAQTEGQPACCQLPRYNDDNPPLSAWPLTAALVQGSLKHDDSTAVASC